VLRQDPHPPTTVAAVRFMIERSALPFRDIEARTGVNNGTISRWVKKFGWRRHEAARPLKLEPPPERVPLGRTLATRLRARPSGSSPRSRPRRRSMPRGSARRSSSSPTPVPNSRSAAAGAPRSRPRPNRRPAAASRATTIVSRLR
jgi:hypothetical protein